LTDRSGEFGRQRRAAESPGKNADQRDADLHSGQKTVRCFGEVQGDAGIAIARVRHPTQPGFFRGHHRNLRHGKHAVRHQQQQDDGDLKQDLTHAGKVARDGDGRKLFQSGPHNFPASVSDSG
jgi:hypothetical protein